MKHLKLFISYFLLSLLVASPVNATPRAADTFLYEGLDYQLYRIGDMHSVYPMEAYFSKFPDKRPKAQGLSHSGLRRGYLATFEIVKDYLILSDIEILISGGLDPETNYPQVSRKSVLEGLSLKGEALKIDWYTGILELVRGELLEEIKWLEPLKYKNYTLLEIKNGKLIDKRNFSFKEYEQFKDEQFLAFKKTEKYKAERQRSFDYYTDMSESLMGKELGLSVPTSNELDQNFRDRIVDYTSEFLVERVRE
jgi:hypothetical protein